MIIHIKNMLSSRCKLIVKQELNLLGFESHCLELGTVHVTGSLSKLKWNDLKRSLYVAGLDLVDDKKRSFCSLIKYWVAEILGSEEEESDMNMSSNLTAHLNMDYPKISKAFAECNQVTLKQYIIGERVKKVKELISRHQPNLAAISSKLHYSSTAHLCNEFKRVTGYTPKIFRTNL
jgi:YesN/AraC family two-component response regulator